MGLASGRRAQSSHGATKVRSMSLPRTAFTYVYSSSFFLLPCLRFQTLTVTPVDLLPLKVRHHTYPSLKTPMSPSPRCHLSAPSPVALLPPMIGMTPIAFAPNLCTCIVQHPRSIRLQAPSGSRVSVGSMVG